MGSTEPFSLCRYYDGLAGRHHLRLADGRSDQRCCVRWGYFDQLVLDQGSTALAWLLTLQHDPPQALFSEAVAAPATGVQPFSPLADQKWITSALGYLREMDLIASRRAESKQKPKKPPGLPPPPSTGQPGAADDADLSKKQLRAAQWAAKRASQASAPPPAK